MASGRITATRKLDSGFHASQARTIDLGSAVHTNHMTEVVFPRMWCGITWPLSLASQKYTASLGWEPGSIERSFVDAEP